MTAFGTKQAFNILYRVKACVALTALHGRFLTEGIQVENHQGDGAKRAFALSNL
jgi:hypothetical protein